MDGVRGYSNWRWVFILEGIATILIGIVAFFGIADFPEEVNWLTVEERIWVLARTRRNKEPAHKVVAKDILHFFSDPKNILGGIIYFGKRIRTLQDLDQHADLSQPSHGCANLRYDPIFKHLRLIIHFLTRSTHRFRLFCSNNHQNAWLLDRANPTAYRTTCRCRLGAGPDYRLLV